MLFVTFLHDRLVKHSLNRSLFARDITLLFVKLGFSCTDVVGIKKKFIKWSLISLIIVPASFAEPREFVKIWSIRDIELPCILVAFVINWRKPLLINVSINSILRELTFNKFILSSRVTNDVSPVTDILSSRLSNSRINSFMASELDKLGGGLGDLYTLERIYFFLLNLIQIERHSKIFSRKGDRFFCTSNSILLRT